MGAPHLNDNPSQQSAQDNAWPDSPRGNKCTQTQQIIFVVSEAEGGMGVGVQRKTKAELWS
jgi:hypothetical protein